LPARIPQGPMHEIQRLYYDIASATSDITFGALTKFVPISQLLFGSDFPYWPNSRIVEGLESIGLSSGEIRAIERDNALWLFPAYAGAADR